MLCCVVLRCVALRCVVLCCVMLCYGMLCLRQKQRRIAAATTAQHFVSASQILINNNGKVVYLHYTTVDCVCLSVVLVAFRSC